MRNLGFVILAASLLLPQSHNYTFSMSSALFGNVFLSTGAGAGTVPLLNDPRKVFGGWQNGSWQIRIAWRAFSLMAVGAWPWTAEFDWPPSEKKGAAGSLAASWKMMEFTSRDGIHWWLMADPVSTMVIPEAGQGGQDRPPDAAVIAANKVQSRWVMTTGWDAGGGTRNLGQLLAPPSEGGGGCVGVRRSGRAWTGARVFEPKTQYWDWVFGSGFQSENNTPRLSKKHGPQPPRVARNGDVAVKVGPNKGKGIA